MFHNCKMKERTHSDLVSNSLCCRNWWGWWWLKINLQNRFIDPLAIRVDAALMSCASHPSLLFSSEPSAVALSLLAFRIFRIVGGYMVHMPRSGDGFETIGTNHDQS